MPHPPIIDIHAHTVLSEAVQKAQGYSAVRTPVNMEGLTKQQREELEHWMARLQQRWIDIGMRLEDMDRMGVDIQVLTPSSVFQNTGWADADTAVDLERRSNAAIAEMIADNPTRFMGLGNLPSHSIALAIQEMERCVTDMGLRGVQISSQIEGKELGDPAMEEFWAAAEKFKAVVYMHPSGNLSDRFKPYELWNSVGQPFEETMVISSLIYAGVPDRFPDLRICISHGGGYLPYYIGRLDRNYKDKPQTALNMSRSPSEYLKFFYYDSCVYNEDILEYLVQKVGAERIVLGSDYPIGEEDPVGFVRDAEGLTDADKAMVLGGTAARLFPT